MPSLFSPQLAPVLMLVASNVFMTFAWYGHLRYRSTPLLIAIVVSWGIAFVEYCLAVPANRMGAVHYSTAELKTIQEVVTLLVFVAFSWLYLREPLGWNHIVGFALIALGAAVVFLGKGPA
ncbi:MAG TPA: DMT family protein [Vitreimonas sp.]|nr:DMT family protein [Vitreimonas sp.]